MTKGPIVLTVSLALVAALALAPLAVPAERFHGRPVDGGSIVTRPVVPRPMVPSPFGSRPFFPRPLFHRPFFPRFTPFGLFATPIVMYASPSVYGPPAYADPPPVYSAPASLAAPANYDPPLAPTVSIAPPPSPMPSVVEHPTGRYELRGDGITTPYRWVWIPNPPSFPPPDPQESAPVSTAPSASGGQSSARHGQLYHWTDAQGVEHWTDRSETVPDQYRGPATQPRPS